jgi:hypothetical protein
MTRKRAAALPPNDWRSRNPEFQEPKLSKNLELAERLDAVGKRHGRNAKQVEGIIGAAEIELTSQEVASLNA